MTVTPHMMGKDMQYGGILLLSVAGVKDEATGMKAKAALTKVAGVAKVTLYPKQEAVGIEFAGKGKATSKQLLDALKAAGLHGAQYVSASEPRGQAMNGGNGSMPGMPGMAMDSGAMAGMTGQGMMGQGMACGCGSSMQMTSPGLRYGISASARGGCGCR